MRKFLDRSIGGADELAGYALAIGTAWGLAATLIDRAHIRINSLYVMFPQNLRACSGPFRPRFFWSLLCTVAWHGSGVSAILDVGLAQPVRAGNPTVIPQAIWIVGLLAFV